MLEVTLASGIIIACRLLGLLHSSESVPGILANSLVGHAHLFCRPSSELYIRGKVWRD